MPTQKGIAHIVPIILILILVIVLPLLVIKFVFKKNLPLISDKKPTVELKTEYSNPFEKNTQYTNPFDEFKNPFVAAR